METTVTAALLLGFVLGLKHAIEPDHLVAVTTIVSEHRSVGRSTLVGTLWGLGHTASLFAVGLVVLLLRVSIPKQTAEMLELGVAAMLVALGIAVLVKVVRERGVTIHTHEHSHDGESPHAHVHLHARSSHNHSHYLFRLGRKPFLVGMVHGMAGGAALTLMVLATIPSVALGLLYIVLFGVGSIGGMLLMSALISLPFILTARRFSTLNMAVRAVAGVVSVGFGLVLGWQLISGLAQ
jgi:ABC-type nickel/cobalt efflux system permease component RcnA